MNKILFSSNSEEWGTPQALFDELNQKYKFTLDPCATSENAKCKKFFTKENDGLKQSWKNERVFCNPPYGKAIKFWIKKADFEIKNGAKLIVLLIPARTDTKFFHEFIYKKHEIIFLKGRLHFNESKNSAPFPSMIVIMKGENNE